MSRVGPAACAICWGRGRTTEGEFGKPCPRCEPEEREAGVPCCRLCGGAMFTIPGQRANLGWLCGRCSPDHRREHARLLANAVRSTAVDWSKDVEGWRLW